MKYLFRYLNVFLVVFLILNLGACESNKKKSNPKESILSLLEINEAQYQEALSLGLILEAYDTSCFAELRIKSSKLLPEFNIVDSLSKQKQLINIIELLYLHSGDIIGSAKKTSDLNLNDLESLSNKMELGNLIPQCAEISKFSEAIFRQKFKGFGVEVVEINAMDHTLNLAS